MKLRAEGTSQESESQVELPPVVGRVVYCCWYDTQPPSTLLLSHAALKSGAAHLQEALLIRNDSPSLSCVATGLFHLY